MLGVSLPLVCNMFLVVCFFVVRAREADRRAQLALRGVCGERGRLVCDAYSTCLRYKTARGRTIDTHTRREIMLDERRNKIPDLRNPTRLHTRAVPPQSSQYDTRLRGGRGAVTPAAALVHLRGYYGRAEAGDAYGPIPGLHDQVDQHLDVGDAVAKRPRLGRADAHVRQPCELLGHALGEPARAAARHLGRQGVGLRLGLGLGLGLGSGLGSG